MRQAYPRIQDVPDADVLCKEGVYSTFTAFAFKGATPSNPSHGELLDDTSTKAFSAPSTAFIRGFVNITGPSSIGNHFGYQNQTFLMTFGNLACARSPEDPSKWLGYLQGIPEQHVLQADGQRFKHHDHLDPKTMHLAFLSQTIEYYLNGSGSIYACNRSVETLGFLLNFLQTEVHKDFLKSIPDSVVLVRCDIPFYNPLNRESKEIIEQVVVEYFRSPWTMSWNRRIRSAQVQNPHFWYLSLANGSEKSDDSFFDGYNSNDHETQLLQATTASLAAVLMPTSAASPPGSGTLMEVDIQPLVSPNESGYTTMVQPTAPVLPSDALSLPGTSFRPLEAESVSLAQPQLSVTTYQSMGTSDSSLETIDLDEGESLADATQDHVDNDSSNDNGNSSGQSFVSNNANNNVESGKPYPCPYLGCPKSFTKKGNQKTHTTKHYENYPCHSCRSIFRQKTDRARHVEVVHQGKRWKCDYCHRLFTRKDAVKQHTCYFAEGRPRAYQLVALLVGNATDVNANNVNANNVSNN